MDEFEIEHDGKKYTCTRSVTGGRTLNQEIHVFGVGSKVDPADYGPHGRLISSMASAAKLIAHEIVQESEKT